MDALGACREDCMTPLKVAVVGGECTGKTELCQALAVALPGLWVPEYLREFVDRAGRAPAASDQAAILAAQIEREAVAVEAATRSGMRWVACDSAPIVTAIYSEMYFDDVSLYASAEWHHRSYNQTLLMDTDLPWEPDGLQRDSPGVRAESHLRIKTWLRDHGVPFTLVSGSGPARVAVAVAALRAVESLAR
jgi:nicotinamide riboside kinase